MKKIIAFILFLFVNITFTHSEEKKPPKVWSGDTELGFKFTKGNSNENSLAVRQSIVFDKAPWKNTLHLAADNTQNNGIRSEEKYYFTEKLDRSITESSYAFVRGSYSKDLFSGFEYQATYVVGYGHIFVDSKDWTFSTEAGLGGIYEKVDDASQGNDSLLYFLAEKLSWKFSKSAELGQEIILEYAEINNITRANVFVRSSLTSSLSLRLSYGFKHNSEVAENKKNTDIEALASVVYSF